MKSLKWYINIKESKKRSNLNFSFYFKTVPLLILKILYSEKVLSFGDIHIFGTGDE